MDKKTAVPKPDYMIQVGRLVGDSISQLAVVRDLIETKPECQNAADVVEIVGENLVKVGIALGQWLVACKTDECPTRIAMEESARLESERSGIAAEERQALAEQQVAVVGGPEEEEKKG